jgi:hypothetical protein
MQSRLLIKVEMPGHNYDSPQSTHGWVEIKRTRKNIIYECLYCDRHHQRKIKGRRKIFKTVQIMKKALA